MLQPVRIFAIAPILWTPRRLHIGRLPRPRAQRPQSGRRMKSASSHFEIIRLQDQATLPGPELLQAQDQILERARRVWGLGAQILSLSYPEFMASLEGLRGRICRSA